MNKILIAAPSSGSGKTLITLAMLKAFSDRGLKVKSFKCGPDYIDPMFHEKVLGVPGGNLDLFFTGEDAARELFCKDNDADISVIEGVMGLFDGLGAVSEEASAYHVARTLKAPVILVVDGRGMGRSLLGLIGGFLAQDLEHLIGGVILNRVSESFLRTIAPIIEEELRVPVLGCFPEQKDLVLESRHLGLKLPGEIADLRDKVGAAALILEKYVDLDKVLRIAENAGEADGLTGDACSTTGDTGSTPGDACNTPDSTCKPARFRLGVARDEAFCFYYRENFRALEEAGAELVFFSPLHDKHLPEGLDGLLFGGGYPELKAWELSQNVSMHHDIREAIRGGMPSLAECGGFMYLHEAIVDKEGRTCPMVGMIPGKCADTGKLVRFGYAEFDCEPLGFKVRGHEFHYFDSEDNGIDCLAVKPVSGRNWRCMHAGADHLWGWGHLYYPSQPAFAEWFAGVCLARKEND